MPEDVAEQILQMCRVPDEPSVYVLGTLARTVNFRAQQIRAHNLAWALNSIEEGEIAVIGGGVSGATFAMAAQQLGFVVTLFERHEKILSIQAQNHTRYIHPTIALWPFERLSSEKAGVPFLNWSEDLVKNVIAEMREKLGQP